MLLVSSTREPKLADWMKTENEDREAMNFSMYRAPSQSAFQVQINRRIKMAMQEGAFFVELISGRASAVWQAAAFRGEKRSHWTAWTCLQHQPKSQRDWPESDDLSLFFFCFLLRWSAMIAPKRLVNCKRMPLCTRGALSASNNVPSKVSMLDALLWAASGVHSMFFRMCSRSAFNGLPNDPQRASHAPSERLCTHRSSQRSSRFEPKSIVLAH